MQSVDIEETIAQASCDARAVAKRVAAYNQASWTRSLTELAITFIPLVASTLLALWALSHRVWWGLGLTPLAGGLLVRLFLIQHDCGHRAFFPSAKVNDWVGRALGVLTLTPFDYWRRTHALHHAKAGALDDRTLGGIDTLTVEEYQALSPARRLGYWLFRHPVVMFGIGPAFVFWVQQRIPVGLMNQGWRAWVSPLTTNLGLMVLVGTMVAVFGVAPVLLVWLPITMLAASAGVWLFFVQHQFEDTYWARKAEWSFHESALWGSSHYDLPPILRWFSANVGIHHIHHLSSRIPYYRLNQVLRDEPALGEIGRLTLMQSFKCVGLALWDEPSQQLISFREMRRQMRAELAA